MRRVISLTLLVTTLMGGVAAQGSADPIAANKAQCTQFGFKTGTDAFATCVMNLTQQQKQSTGGPSQLQQYTTLSMQRRGDDRYPVCSAVDMENDLNTDLNKWVGPNCQMAGD